MILDAFATYLQKADQSIAAPSILARWLWERLSVPAESVIDQVLHCELSLVRVRQTNKRRLALRLTDVSHYPSLAYVFKGNSASGLRLLESLYEFSLSYEQQRWARFVHSLKASDFATRNRS